MKASLRSSGLDLERGGTIVMKKYLMFACLLVIVMFGTADAMAESIAGRFGVTGRLGFLIPHDSDFEDFKLETDAAFVGGGGLIYGIDRMFAVELDITRSEFGSNRVSGRNTGDFGITDIALGAQYRFNVQNPKLLPYLGAGLDILLTDYTTEFGVKAKVDDTVGIHLNGGLDYFFLKAIAVNVELKALVTAAADINAGVFTGHFDPSNVSGTVGIRYFFN
jgi:outer membrane protein